MAKYNQPMLEWLAENYKVMTLTDFHEKFNVQFGTNFTRAAISSCLFRKKILSGRTGYVTPGWNKGIKNSTGKSSTSFKKGHVPHNVRNDGDERICSDGYSYRKIGKKWLLKHVIIYEAEHGKLRKGEIVIFKDGDTLNFDKSNLEKLTRQELLKANLHQYSKLAPEIKPAVLALSKLEAAGRFLVILK
jgi:hypothetical protein